MTLLRFSSFLRYVRRHELIFDLLSLGLLWCASAILVDPSGNFPLNDDWSYGMAVKRLLEEGVFRPTGWTAMPLISQVLWGALFCVPFGFSFVALRISTLSLGLVGIIFLYLLIKQMEGSRGFAYASSLSLAFNPIYCGLSYTFMTDVPFVAFVTVALYFLVRNLRSGSDIFLVFGTVFSTLAILCRHVGLFVPISFALTSLFKYGLSPKWICRALLPFTMGTGSLALLQIFFGLSGTTPSLYHSATASLFHIPEGLLPAFMLFAFRLFTCLLYLGLFLLPVILFSLVFRPKREEWPVASWLVVPLFVCVAGVMLFSFGATMPLWPDEYGNILTSSGIGPDTLPKSGHANVQSIGKEFWLAVTLLSILGGGIVLARVVVLSTAVANHFCKLRSDNWKLLNLFLLLAALTYVIPVAVPKSFDRYVIPLIPLLCASLVSHKRQAVLPSGRAKVASVIVVIGAFSIFSTACAKDYLAWNRVRWAALNKLVGEERVSPTEIDGGFEFNGWYLYDGEYKRRPSKSWWWVHDDAYMLSWGEVEGYDVFRRYSFAQWVPQQTRTLLVLRRHESAQRGTTKSDDMDAKPRQ